jgi:serine protease inhibitor
MVAGEAVTAFGVDLFGAARSQPDAAHANLTISPMSVAAALAMLEPGTVGDAQGRSGTAPRVTPLVLEHLARRDGGRHPLR